MRETEVVVRAARLDQGAWQLAGGGDSWRTVLAYGGARRAELQPGWSATAALDLGGTCFLLMLVNLDGSRALWVLDQEVRFLCDLDDLGAPLSPEIHFAVRRAAADLLDHLRNQPWLGREGPWATLRDLGGGALDRLAKFAGRRARSWALDDLADPLPIRAREETVAVDPERLGELVEHTALSIMMGAAETGRLDLPALSGPGRVDAAFLVGRTHLFPTYLCVETASQLAYYLIVSPEFPTAVYFPRDNVFVSQARLDPSVTSELLARLDGLLLPLAAGSADPWPTATPSAALFSIGLPNFGHAIWEEFHGFDTFLAAVPPENTPPSLYLVEGHTGADLYGPVEELYPELEDRVVRLTSELAAFRQAINAGVTLIVRTGIRSLRASRERILRVVERQAAETGLASEVEATLAPGGQRRLAVTLGLRLTNRKPTDLLGFYVRLTTALIERFGPLVVVIDGINGGAEPGKPATSIYNGVKRADASFIEALRDGSKELREELDWVAAYRQALQRREAEIVSCVGMPIRDNIYWMSKTDFFVAPLGGGLAKLRWALDVPGFVLSSRVNLDYCSLLHAYDDETFMEGPFTPLHLTAHDDVVDLPLDPPRREPAQMHGIPHPEDFRIVREKAVIARIVELVASHAPPGTRRAEAPKSRGLFKSLRA